MSSTHGAATAMIGLLLARLGRWVHGLEDALLTVTLTTMVGVAVAQIALRNLAGVSLVWADPLVRLLVLWGGLLGALVATREGKHIRFDVLLRLVSRPLARRLEAVALLVAGGVCAIMGWISLQFIVDEYHFGGTVLPGLATWQAQLVFPLVFFGMTCRFLAHVPRTLRA